MSVLKMFIPYLNYKITQGTAINTQTMRRDYFICVLQHNFRNSWKGETHFVWPVILAAKKQDPYFSLVAVWSSSDYTIATETDYFVQARGELLKVESSWLWCDGNTPRILYYQIYRITFHCTTICSRVVVVVSLLQEKQRKLGSRLTRAALLSFMLERRTKVETIVFLSA